MAASNYKLSFKEQLRWALYGIVGVLIPALASLSFPISAVVLLAAFTSLGIGILIGRDLRQATNEQIINEQAGRIERFMERLRKGRKDISHLKTALTQHQKEILKREGMISELLDQVHLQYVLTNKDENKQDRYLTIDSEGVFNWGVVPSFAIKFVDKQSADAFLSGVLKFSFTRGAQVVNYPIIKPEFKHAWEEDDLDDYEDEETEGTD